MVSNSSGNASLLGAAVLLSSSLAMAQTGGAGVSPSPGAASATAPVQSASSAAASTPDALQEVVVTAQKREERLQDVPVPVTALSAQTLVESNQLRLQDYVASVPGFNVTPADEGSQFLSIRGITTGGHTSSTVGIMVDDVPFGGTGSTVVPDLDPGDLARVEVLRGPQGTLYGASSMGGLVKFVTVDPTTDSVYGRVEGGMSSVENGSKLGYNLRGSVNLPVTDTLAVRASAFTHTDPGYIDNPVLGLEGVNEQRVGGGRLSALWRPSEVVSLKLNALYQDTHGNGSNAVEPPNPDYPQTFGLRDLQANDLRGIGWYDRIAEVFSATLTAKLGKIDLTAVSGYNINREHDSLDYSYALGGFTDAVFGVSGSPIITTHATRKFTQEIRLSSTIFDRVDWLFGAFYTHESGEFSQDILAVEPATGQTVGMGYSNTGPTPYTEYAGFGDLTFHITDRFDVQVGGRESAVREIGAGAVTVGPYTQAFTGGPSPHTGLPQNFNENSFTYLFTPRLKLSDDLMIYARLASGYRPGGSNTLVPIQFEADKTENYELGLKGDYWDHRLSFDVSLYYIDWKNIQIQLLDPNLGVEYITNAGAARSKGVELSLESRPLTGLTVSGWMTFSDATLTAVPADSSAYEVPGDRLPYSGRFSANLSAQQEWLLQSGVKAFVGGTESYVGERESVFLPFVAGGPQTPRTTFPGYAKTDLRSGVKYGPWTGTLYVNNATDRRGVIGGGLGGFPPFGVYYIQPRTVGISLGRNF